MAIAEHESGFNPDAANKGSTASDIFQITDGSARDSDIRLSGSNLIGGYTISLPYDRFDPISNIETGIAIYLDKKRVAGSDDISKIYKKFNPSASEVELNNLDVSSGRLHAVSCGTQQSHLARAGANGWAGRCLSLDMRR